MVLLEDFWVLGARQKMYFLRYWKQITFYLYVREITWNRENY